MKQNDVHIKTIGIFKRGADWYSTLMHEDYWKKKCWEIYLVFRWVYY